MPYPSRKIRRIRACTHQRPQRKLDQYAVSSEDQYAVLEIQYMNILEDIKRDPYSKKPQYALNTAYPLPSDMAYPIFCPIQRIHSLINTAYPLPLDTAYRSCDKIRMTKVIKEEFEKIKDIKVEDVSLTYDTPFEIFNNEVSRLSEMDDDVFTYEVEVANIQCDPKMDDDSEHEADDDKGYDMSDVAFT
ncbi:hypothetical protein Tco_0597947, partial [Tanacetum coccineum]